MASSKSGYEGKIAGLYDLDRTLGKGHFAVVKLARHVFTGQLVAVKVIDKTKLDSMAAGHLLQEVRCMKLVQHPNVVRLYEVIDTQTKLYLILELGDGGDMYDYIMRHEGGVSEDLAKVHFAQIVCAISYCHRLHVVHRDLKPENVVFFRQQGTVKLTDFGFSNRFQPGTMLMTSCGSLAYSAPEILLGEEYDAPAVDVWSLGVILYMLVCGQPPFQEANDSETLIMIMDCRYTVPARISPECKDLISRMLQRDPLKRASLEEIESHPWLNGVDPLPTSRTTVPLTSYKSISEEEHEIIIQAMTCGHIADRDTIQEALEADRYNHITATYFLLAERILREKQDRPGQTPSAECNWAEPGQNRRPLSEPLDLGRPRELTGGVSMLSSSEIPDSAVGPYKDFTEQTETDSRKSLTIPINREEDNPLSGHGVGQQMGLFLRSSGSGELSSGRNICALQQICEEEEEEEEEEATSIALPDLNCKAHNQNLGCAPLNNQEQTEGAKHLVCGELRFCPRSKECNKNTSSVEGLGDIFEEQDDMEGSQGLEGKEELEQDRHLLKNRSDQGDLNVESNEALHHNILEGKEGLEFQELKGCTGLEVNGDLGSKPCLYVYTCLEGQTVIEGNKHMEDKSLEKQNVQEEHFPESRTKVGDHESTWEQPEGKNGLESQIMSAECQKILEDPVRQCKEVEKDQGLEEIGVQEQHNLERQGVLDNHKVPKGRSSQNPENQNYPSTERNSLDKSSCSDSQTVVEVQNEKTLSNCIRSRTQCCQGKPKEASPESGEEPVKENNNNTPKVEQKTTAPSGSPKTFVKNHCVDTGPAALELQVSSLTKDNISIRPLDRERWGPQDREDGESSCFKSPRRVAGGKESTFSSQGGVCLATSYEMGPEPMIRIDPAKNKNVNLRDRLLQFPLCEKALSFKIKPSSKESLMPFGQFNCCHVL
ncbi:SNF related kinase b [Huso huso]|uniref:non-specific serine/threonine protein kinase n=1 Tax=Huso huso TaxID=61971 RepID=A0ABR0YXB9_HUSHU